MKKFSVYLVFISFFSISQLFAFQTPISFTRENFNLLGASAGAVEYGDFDSDGDLDLLEIGEGNSVKVGMIYKNENGTFSSGSFIDLPFKFLTGDAKWGDYDRDGDLDILLSGQSSSGRLTSILRNDGGAFNEVDFGLVNLQDSAVEWADIDNDGDLDAVISGFDQNFKRRLLIYINNGTTFDNVFDDKGIMFGDLEIVDYDNDGDMDIFMTGLIETQSSPQRATVLLRNDDGTFVNSGFAFVPMQDASSDFGDFDSDGDLDLLLSGNGNDDGTLEPRTIVYKNNITGFERQTFALNNLEQSDVKWADFDNDGDLDFIQAGLSISGDYVTEIYENIGSGFIKNQEGVIDTLKNCAISVGDYDNDGDVDFALSGWDKPGTRNTVVYSNLSSTANTKPTPPATINNNVVGNTVELSWSMGDDGQTLPNGLTYNLRIGSSQGGQDILTAHVNTTGMYKLSRRGNMESRLSKVVTHLSSGTYYWGVQSVDNNYIVSGPKSGSFIIASEPVLEITSPVLGNTLVGGEPFNITWTSNAVENVDIKFSSNGGVSWSLVAKSVPASQGKYEWAVPEIQSATNKIRLSATENTAIQSTSGVFIIGSRFIVLQYPNGGEIFQPDSSIFVDWIAPYSSNFKLEYSTNNGVSWTEINTVDETFGESSEPWTIPNTPSENCRVKITDLLHPSVFIISEGTFSIVNDGASYISIIAPNGGEEWEAGSFALISWDYSNVTNIKIELSTEGSSGPFSTIVESTPADGGVYNWSLPNFVSPNCFVRLSDVNDLDINDISKMNFFITDTTGPAIGENGTGNFDYPAVVDEGDQDTIKVNVVDNTSVIEVLLFYKEAGTFNSFQPQAMNKAGDIYSWLSVPVPLNGIQFFIQARDEQENISRTDTLGISVRVDDKYANPIENVGGNTVENYALFSVPVDLYDKSPATFLKNNNFNDTPDPQDYRFYSYQNGSASNFIEYNNNGFGLISPGRAFFILSNDDFNMVAGDGTTLNPGDTYPINGLPQGWSLIGNPFPWAIPSANIRAVNPGNGATVNFTLWGYDGGWSQVQGAELKAWKGYAIHLDNSANLQILPFRESLAKTTPVFTTQNNNSDEWMIQIAARNGKSKSDFNFVGQRYDATDGIDKFDLDAPPRLEKQVVLNFANDDKTQIVTDIRQSNNQGHVWDFTCYTDPGEEKLDLSFSGISDFSSQKDAFLIDEATGISYNLKNTSDLQFAVKGVSSKNFNLAVGSKDYLEGLNLKTELYPKEFSLKQNFPNPFNPSTQISFTIKDAGMVNLTIYDLIGREVVRLINGHLEPGNYNAVWDAAGQSSGIYFIKLTSGRQVAIKRAIFIK